MLENNQLTKRHLTGLASIFLLLIVSVVTTSYYYYHQTRENLVNEKYEEIKTLTVQKANRVSYWIDERKAEGTYLATNNVLLESLNNYSFIDDIQARHRIDELFEQLRVNHDYSTIAFLDTNGIPLLTTGLPVETGVNNKYLLIADTSRKPILLQDELDAIIPSPVILTAVFLKNKTRMGYIYQKIDIRTDIRPVVQSELTGKADFKINLIFLKDEQFYFILDTNGVPYLRDKNSEGTIADQIISLVASKKDGKLGGTGFDKKTKIGYLARVNGYNLFIYTSATLNRIEEPLTPIFILLTIIIIITIAISSLGAVLVVKNRESKYIGKIAESEAFLESIREGMSDGFIVFDEDMKVIAANTKAISLFGKSRESFTGIMASEFIPRLETTSFYQNFVDVRRLKKPIKSVDYIQQWDTYFQNKFFPVHNGIALFFSDITEEIKLKEALHITNKQLESLNLHLQVVTENEREAIAREIHDELGQALTSLKMNLAMIRNSINATPNNVDSSFILDEMATMGKQIDDTVKRIRRIITELRPEVLDHLGLVAAIEWLVDDSQVKSPVKYKVIKNVEDIDLDKVVATALFRIVQETVTNINRHSKATNAEILINYDDPGLTIAVSDNGVGFSQKGDTPVTSFGLLGMRERAKLINAHLNINSVVKSGTTVTIKVDNLKNF